jgi:group II intron reverse transcriptase/maturase
MGDTLRSQTVSTKLQRIAEQAVRCPDMIFITLVHHIDVEFLREAYRRIRKDGAPGIDKVTAKEYAENLEENLGDLYERLRSGRYKAPPVERVWIDKENGEKRPIGKTTFEDKIVQRAVVMLLSAIYETMFYDFSHGFREGHSQHQALKELRELCRIMNIGWIVDADIRGLFDNLDHKHLRELIQRRINDGGILRLVGKWLNAGVMEGRTLWYPEQGTPQGGVISPLLSNIFLHYVLDDWFVKEVQPLLRGRCFLLRFADDFIIGFELEEDARRVMDVLPKRFGRFGLALHPEKTKIVKFKKPKAGMKHDNENSTFDFLGFTHYWARSLRGYWVIKRKTIGKRLRRTIKSLWEWCRNNRHLPLLEQYRKLCSKLRGHYQYYGIRCNYRMLEVVFEKVKRAWRYWLSRRSHKGNISWEKFEVIKRNLPLPRPRIVHNI